MRTQLLCTEAAIEADRHRLRVAHGVPECLDRMARQVASRKIGQRQRDHQRDVLRKLLFKLLHRHDRGLAVERIEHGFDQDRIDPTFDQRGGLLAVNLDNFVEGYFAISGVFDIGRQRQRLVGRPHRAAHETLAAILRSRCLARLTDDLGRRNVHFAHEVFRPVIGLADPVGVEGVGRQHRCASGNIFIADRADHLRLGQVDEVVITLLVVGQPGIACIILGCQLRTLDRGAIGAVLYQDMLRRLGQQFVADRHYRCSFGRMPSMWQIA